MHNLNTGLITATFPTQIVGVAYNPIVEDTASPRVTAFVSVKIDGESHVCQVAAPSDLNFDDEQSIRSVEEWNEVTDNTEVVPRTVTLIAQPSSDVVGTAHFQITQIDLRVEEGIDRYFATVIR